MNINVEELQKMGRESGIKLLAKHEKNGTLVEYINKVAPEFVFKGEVHKFELLKVLGW